MARPSGILWSLCITSLFAADPSGMVLIQGGEFTRGRTFEWPDYDVKWYPNAAKDDQPARKILLDSFYLDQSEVTNQQYAHFARQTGHRVPYQWRKGEIPEGKERHPVVNVSWDDATAFCAWEQKRLPTEAEWERAARGPSGGGMYPWGDRKIAANDAVYSQIDGEKPVCTAARNGFELCDMIGNVWEWCSDWYGQHYYSESPELNPEGPATGEYRVLRGGSWFDVPPLFLTPSYRSWARQRERSPTIGFRCARSVSKTSAIQPSVARK